MARADLLVSLVKTGMEGDVELFRETVSAVVADAKTKKHFSLAQRLTALLETNVSSMGETSQTLNAASRPYQLKSPERGFEDLILPSDVIDVCREVVQEHSQREKLRQHNLQPRHRLLLSGPPGNGKTSLAEAIAYELGVPFYVVRYEGIIGSYLGETAKQLAKVFEAAKSQRCVLFFDEFDALSKERRDPNEVGEIKRVVNSLLVQIDALPSNVIVIGATNHADLLDHASWRRFQVHIDLPLPTEKLAEKWLNNFQQNTGKSFGIASRDLARELEGLSFAELENFALSVLRKFILSQSDVEMKSVLDQQLLRRKKLQNAK